MIHIVVPNTAGEQIVLDTWDLASIDGAWRLLLLTKYLTTVSDFVISKLSTYENLASCSDTNPGYLIVLE